MRRTGARIAVNEEVLRDGEGFREIVIKGGSARDPIYLLLDPYLSPI